MKNNKQTMVNFNFRRFFLCFLYSIITIFVVFVFEKVFIVGYLDYVLPTRIPKTLSRAILFLFVITISIFLIFLNLKKIIIEKFNEKHIIFFLFAISITLPLVLVFLIKVEPKSDFLTYYLIAKHLVYSKIFIPNYIATFPHTIMFPIFLSFIFRIFGPSILAAQLTGILLSAMSVIFVFLIGKEAGKKQLGFIAAIMWSLMPSRIFYSLLICTENLFNTVALFTIFLFFRNIRAFKSIKTKYLNLAFIGILLAWLSSIRPNGIILFIAMTLFYIVFSKETNNNFLKKDMNNIHFLKFIAIFIMLATYLLASFSLNIIIESIINQKIASTRIGWNLYVGMNISSHGQWNKNDSELFGRLIKEIGPNQAQKTFFNLGLTRLQTLIKEKKIISFISDKIITMWHADHESYDYVAGAQLQNTAGKLIFPKNNKIIKLLFNIYYYIILFTALLGLILEIKNCSFSNSIIIIGGLVISGTILLHMPFEAALRYKNHALLWFCFISANGIITASGKIVKANKIQCK